MNMTAVTKEYDLTERYTKQRGEVLLTGVQALVRALLDRAQLDQQAGLATGGFVSGYRGSPLGGFDKALWAESARLDELGIKFQAGVNEDLAATAVWGSQQVGLHPGNKVDGVFGLWYGKAPGLDRSCDAIRHANAWGTSARGGVLLVVGDDPAAKSSSIASQSEFALQDMQVPVLCPANVQDVLDFAQLGWEMSRHSGLWVGLKAIADHMDSAANVQLAQPLPQRHPAPADVHIRRQDTPQEQETRVLAEKLPLALEYARQAGLNRWLTRDCAGGESQVGRHKSRLGVICAGKSYTDVREAFALLGLPDLASIAAAGAEVLKLGMSWPLDEQLVQEFAATVDTVLVVEEKRAFVEPQVLAALYGQRQIPVLGKRDRQGAALLSQTGILEPGDIALLLADELALKDTPTAARALRQIRTTRLLLADTHAPAKTERAPMFCAGCPHNTSTRVPAGSRATAGIGCHYMVQWMDRDTDSCTQMGGEGVTWVGEAPFTEENHMFANLGDGTYFHSGLLAIRQAVAAQVNITYKVLFNDAVAMTGGQSTDGELTVAGLIAQVRAEGVRRVVVVSDEPAQHADLDVEVYARDKLDQVQQQLREQRGVTVLVYQQMCATELRRRRKRKMVADDKPRVVINSEVCEDCGDCTAVSQCVAIEPVATPMGNKRQVNQTSCNKDLSCADGFCPAFVTVKGELRKTAVAQDDDQLETLRQQLPAPQVDGDTADLLLAGVGGTGIVTVSALLAAAAQIEGKTVRTLDMTGLAQKGGAVFAHVRLGCELAPRIPTAGADAVLACDLVSAATEEALHLLHKGTRVFVNSHVMPTAEYVLQAKADNQARQRMKRLRMLCPDTQVVDAVASVTALLGDATQTNVLMLGFAYQNGVVPLAVASIEAALRSNGTQVRQNLLAFHVGRQLALQAAAGVVQPAPAGGRAGQAQLPPAEDLPAVLNRLRQHLYAYQGEALVMQFNNLLERVATAEAALKPGSEVLTRAVAESLARVLTPKDEFEVARLHGGDTFMRTLRGQFAPGARVNYLLAPPLLGKRKRSFGPWMQPVFRLLARCKSVRNTWLDPFRFTADRRLDLALAADFISLVEQMLTKLSLQNLPIAVSLAKLPMSVRGFGHIKAARYGEMQAQQAKMWTEFVTPPQVVQLFEPRHAA